jgi:hypothetical protein
VVLCIQALSVQDPSSAQQRQARTGGRQCSQLKMANQHPHTYVAVHVHTCCLNVLLLLLLPLLLLLLLLPTLT